MPRPLSPALSPVLSILALAAVVSVFVASTLLGCRRAVQPSAAGGYRTATLGQDDDPPATTRATSRDIGRSPEAAQSATPDASGAAELEAKTGIKAPPQGVTVPEPTAVAPRPPARPDVSDRQVGARVLAALDAPPDPAVAHEALSLVSMRAARRVEARVPQGTADTFSPGDVFAWVAVKNPGPRTDLTMIWRRDGKRRSQVRLKVGTSPRWRTWSKVHMRPSDVGLWTVEVRSAAGRLLDTLRFDVSPSQVASRRPIEPGPPRGEQAAR